MLIKTFKGTGSHRVSLIEFRKLLVKFGITLSVSETETVFSIFDTDRSGTLDFDEFANWIMSSKYRPRLKDITKEESYKTEKLRELLNKNITSFPQAFSLLESKTDIEFMDMVSNINRLNMSLTERDIRAIFLIFDPTSSGKVKSKSLFHWAKSGSLSRPESSLQDVDCVQECLPPLTPGLLDSKSTHFKKTTFRRPTTQAQKAEMSAPSSSVLSAERRLRDLLKPGYKAIKRALLKGGQYADFIEPEKLHKIVLKYCSPISFTDFRLVLTILRKDETKSKIDCSYFIGYFDPEKHISTQLKLVEKQHQKLKPLKNLSVGKFCGFPTPRK